MANDSFTSVLVTLKEKEFFKNLVIKRGIEKEFFRVDKNGNISNNSHPPSLGSALTNKFITRKLKTLKNKRKTIKTHLRKHLKNNRKA